MYEVKFKAANRVVYLRVNHIDHVLNRQAVVMPLPGDSGSGLPLAFSVDLGQMTQDILLRGSIKDYDDASYATWRDIRHMVVRAWKDLTFQWDNLYDPSYTTRIVYTEPSGQKWTYRCAASRLELTRDGGKEQWDFVLGLSVIVWPPLPYEA